MPNIRTHSDNELSDIKFYNGLLYRTLKPRIRTQVESKQRIKILFFDDVKIKHTQKKFFLKAYDKAFYGFT